MAGENTASVADATKAKPEEEEGRQRSTISFPYEDLSSAVEMAQAIHNNVGLGDCEDDQLASWTNQSPKSSGYRTQLSAARMFGVIESTSGRHRLSELGRVVVDPQRTRDGRVRAFMNVPLYSTVFEKYRGGVLPPTAAFERDIQMLGVAEKMKDRARRVLERSAEQAGFFEQGRNRLVRPGVAVRDDAPVAPPPDIQIGDASQDGNKKGGGGGGGFGDHDPLIIGLFQKLPAPEEEWPSAARLKWLQTAANIFDLLYKGDGGGISVTGARADRSPRPHDGD